MTKTRSANPYAEPVKRGAELLDKFTPGWFKAIATDKLAMETCNRCIFGQLFGGFIAGCRLIGSSFTEVAPFYASKFGFTLPDRDQTFSDEQGRLIVMDRFKQLANAWRAEIRARAKDSP